MSFCNLCNDPHIHVHRDIKAQYLNLLYVCLCADSSVVRYPRYLDTYRRYLSDDTSIASVTIYRGIS